MRHAAVQATYAPSVYNTQPWSLRLTPTDLQLHADPDRWLMSLDRLARQLVISCGCALFNARASVAADGWGTMVHRSAADLASPSLIAKVAPITDVTGAEDAALAELNRYIQAQPNDHPLLSPPVDGGELIDRLRTAASAEGTELLPILNPEYRMALTDAVDRADQLHGRARAGTTDRWAWAGGLTSSEWSNPPVRFDVDLVPAVLCTRTDTASDWVAAGESLQRILLELARSGYAAQLSIPAIEVAEVRSEIQDRLGIASFPQVLLHIGQAAAPPAVPQRRLLVDVIHEFIER